MVISCMAMVMQRERDTYEHAHYTMNALFVLCDVPAWRVQLGIAGQEKAEDMRQVILTDSADQHFDNQCRHQWQPHRVLHLAAERSAHR
jgi:hypothetical protein